MGKRLIDRAVDLIYDSSAEFGAGHWSSASPFLGSNEKTVYRMAITSNDPEMAASRDAALAIAITYMAEKGWNWADIADSSLNLKHVARAVATNMKAEGMPIMPMKPVGSKHYVDMLEDHPEKFLQTLLLHKRFSPQDPATWPAGVREQMADELTQYGFAGHRGHVAPQFDGTSLSGGERMLIPLAHAWSWWTSFPPRTQLKVIGVVAFMLWLLAAIKF